MEEFVENKEHWLTEIVTSEFYNMLYENIKEIEEFQGICQHYLNLKLERTNYGSDLQKFWSSSIHRTDLLLSIIFACRAGELNLLLECITHSLCLYLRSHQLDSLSNNGAWCCVRTR